MSFDHFLWRAGGGIVQFAFLLIICVAVEQVAVIDRYTLKQRIPGATFQLIGIIAGGLITWTLQGLWKSYGAGGLVIPLHDWLAPIPLGGALYVIAMLVVTDFLIYWRHRAEHRWFWPIHAVHHSPRELHAANDIGHPLQCIPDLLMVWLPMSLVQMPGPVTPVAVSLLSSLLTMYIHSPIDFHFGPLRRIVVDNRFHRIHHSLEPRHFDRNFAVCFSVWDWLFGTAYWPARDEWPAVGVADVPPPKTVRDFLAMPLRILADPFDEDVGEVVGNAGEAGIHAEPVGGLGGAVEAVNSDVLCAR